MKTASDMALLIASYERTAASQNLNLAHENYQKALTAEFELFGQDASLDAYEKGIRDAAERATTSGMYGTAIADSILSLLTKPKDKE